MPRSRTSLKTKEDQMSKSGENGWRKPNLTVEGQRAFWNAQSSTYETEEMTTDNQGEIDETLAACREIDCEDIITLGGAVGCRDPKVILEDMFSRKITRVPKVVFNDLAPQQVERARTQILKPFIDQGVEMTFLPGEISGICQKITSRPRRLVLGVYNCQSFFRAEPESGYPFCGYDEYLRNSGEELRERLACRNAESRNRRTYSLGFCPANCRADEWTRGVLLVSLVHTERNTRACPRRVRF